MISENQASALLRALEALKTREIEKMGEKTV
jgi:hypothetical protein